MTIKTEKRFYVTMAPTVYENKYNFNTTTRGKNIRSFIIVVIITAIVQHSIYLAISSQSTTATLSPRPGHTANGTDKSVQKRYAEVPNREQVSIVLFENTDHMCSEKVTWKTTKILGQVTSDMDYWSFDRRSKCPEIDIDGANVRHKRLKLSIKCDDSGTSLKWTNKTSNIYETNFGDDCVNKYISNCCKGDRAVPNVVHYVWYLRGELNFIGFISLVSVIRFINPCLIVFHGDSLPYGRYWDFIVSISPNIIHLKRQRPKSVFGQKIFFDEHSGDIMRIEALLKYGGIYMDTDTVIVRPIDELRRYPCVMSTQYRKLGSAFILAESNSTFLQKWMDGYKLKYNKFDYTYNAMTYPQMLALRYSDLIHVESGTVSRPKDMIGFKLYSYRYETYNWSKIYGVHLFTRLHKGALNEKTIRNMHTACGSILRHVLFGNKELCKLK